jgi:hypothetical protein
MLFLEAVTLLKPTDEELGPALYDSIFQGLQNCQRGLSFILLAQVATELGSIFTIVLADF